MTRHARRRKRPRPPPGSSPGTLTPDPTLPPPVMRVIAYGPEALVERAITRPEELRDFLAMRPVTWLDVDGLGDPRVVEAIGAVLGLHRLSLADVIHTHQRPKFEDFGSYLFVVARMPLRAGGTGGLETEQVSLCLGPSFVVTFQERARPGDCFDGVRDRIRRSVGRVRSLGPDYLAYALIDAAVDACFPIIETLGDRLDALEDEILARAGPRHMADLHAIRRELLTIRRATWPLREGLSTLARDPTPLVKDETRLYLRDCADHALQIIDLVETDREVAASLMDTYLSAVSNRMNQIMQVLTIISTIFIPLTFIVGVYGMNFDRAAGPISMPELGWRYGYVGVWAFMIALALGMLWIFWRRGWIGPKRK